MSDLASYSFGIFQAIDILQLYNRRYNQWKGFLVKLLCFAFGSLVVSICFADKRIFSTVQLRPIHPTTIRSLDGTLKPDRYSCMRICHFVKLRQGSGKDRGGLVIKRPLKGHKIYPLPRAYIKIGCHHHPPTHPPTTIGHLRVTMGHLRLTVG